MDPFIDIGRRQVALSQIRLDTQTRKVYLSDLYRSTTLALCLCCDNPIQMGVARRAGTVPVYYLYHLHRGDPNLHHEQCPHRVESSEAQVSSPDGSNHQEITESSSLVVYTPSLEPRPIDPSLPNSISKLSVLLQSVLCCSGLNVWHPGFIAHRSYSKVRSRIIDASKRIRPFGTLTLDNILFMPPQWNAASVDSINSMWNSFLEVLRPTPDNMIPRGLIIGRLRNIEKRPGWSAPRIKLSEFNISFWLDKCPNLVVDECSDSFSWLVMLVVELDQATRKLHVIDGASIRITAQWIPVFSPAHASQANYLVESEIPFVASLHTDELTKWAVPDLLYRPGNASLKRLHVSARSKVQILAG